GRGAGWGSGGGARGGCGWGARAGRRWGGGGWEEEARRGLREGGGAVVRGAGNGMGRGGALGLAHAGARVVVNDFGVTVDGRDPSSAAAQAVVKEIEALGGEAIANAESVATMAGGQSIVDAALARFGDLHIV